MSVAAKGKKKAVGSNIFRQPQKDESPEVDALRQWGAAVATITTGAAVVGLVSLLVPGIQNAYDLPKIAAAYIANNAPIISLCANNASINSIADGTSTTTQCIIDLSNFDIIYTWAVGGVFIILFQVFLHSFLQIIYVRYLSKHSLSKYQTSLIIFSFFSAILIIVLPFFWMIVPMISTSICYISLRRRLNEMNVIFKNNGMKYRGPIVHESIYIVDGYIYNNTFISNLYIEMRLMQIKFKDISLLGFLLTAPMLVMSLILMFSKLDQYTKIYYYSSWITVHFLFFMIYGYLMLASYMHGARELSEKIGHV